MNKTLHSTGVADEYMRCLTEKDLDGILSLYANNASIEDPVGSERIEGIETLRQFYAQAMGIDMQAERTGTVRIAGQEVAFPFRLVMDAGNGPMAMDIIDVFLFDDQGKILTMRAFWGPDNCRPLGE